MRGGHRATPSPTAVVGLPSHCMEVRLVGDRSTCRWCTSSRLWHVVWKRWCQKRDKKQERGWVPSSAPTQMLALGAFPSTAHAAATSGRQPSVSTNAQPGESEKVRLLLRSTRHEHLGHEQQAPEHEYSQKTHLTSPPTPLQPSLPLVHLTRSLGSRLALDHIPPAAPFPHSRAPPLSPGSQSRSMSTTRHRPRRHLRPPRVRT